MPHSLGSFATTASPDLLLSLAQPLGLLPSGPRDQVRALFGSQLDRLRNAPGQAVVEEPAGLVLVVEGTNQARGAAFPAVEAPAALGPLLEDAAALIHRAVGAVAVDGVLPARGPRLPQRFEQLVVLHLSAPPSGSHL